MWHVRVVYLSHVTCESSIVESCDMWGSSTLESCDMWGSSILESFDMWESSKLLFSITLYNGFRSNNKAIFTRMCKEVSLIICSCCNIRDYVQAWFVTDHSCTCSILKRLFDLKETLLFYMAEMINDLPVL